MTATTVKVKILKHVGSWTPGQVVDIEHAQAKELCKVSYVHNGVQALPTQKAILLEEAEALAALPKDIEQLTRKEALELGVKNVVAGPEARAVEVEEPKRRGPKAKSAE